jgi:hypothetical protein
MKVIADPRGTLPDYCCGYWRRRTGTAFAPMVAMTAPTRASAQFLLHLVANARWADKLMLLKCVNR